MATIDIGLQTSSDLSCVIEPVLFDNEGLQFSTDHATIMSAYTGYEERARHCPENRFSSVFTWNCVTAAQRKALLKFYYQCEGKLNDFWMPTWVHTFALTAGIQSTNRGVWMQNCGFQHVFNNKIYQVYGLSPELLFVKTRDGSMYARPIMQCYAEALMYLTTPFPVDIDANDIVLACRMVRWNFSSGMTEQWVSSSLGQNRIEQACTIKATLTRKSGIDSGKGVTYYG